MSLTNAITIQFNGKSIEVPEAASISQLLQLASVRASVVAVELNEEIVPAALHDSTLLRSGDLVEAVTLVGGG